MNHEVLDTGPLVAFLNRRDRYHAWAVAEFDTISPPIATCDAVLSEACFLVRNIPGGADAVLTLVERGLVSVPFHVEPEAASLRKLMKRYSTVPMSLADACLVRMTELDPRAVVLTIDSDFTIYRRNGRQVIATRRPPAS